MRLKARLYYALLGLNQATGFAGGYDCERRIGIHQCGGLRGVGIAEKKDTATVFACTRSVITLKNVPLFAKMIKNHREVCYEPL